MSPQIADRTAKYLCIVLHTHNEQDSSTTTMESASFNNPNTPLDDAPPAVCVFGIAELLENILQYLPFKQLFYLRRVNKIFRLVLTDYDHAPLARQVFCSPIKKPPFVPVEVQGKLATMQEMEKVMEEWQRGLCLPEHIQCQVVFCKRWRMMHRVADPAYINPIFKRQCLGIEDALGDTKRATDTGPPANIDPAADVDTTGWGVSWYIPPPLPLPPPEPQPQHPKACLEIIGTRAIFLTLSKNHLESFFSLDRNTSPEASWRKTYLTNPPVKRFEAFSIIQGDMVEDDEGVTLEMVARHLEEVFVREEEGRGDDLVGVGAAVAVRRFERLRVEIERAADEGGA
ncbi:uncharacterized protein BDR25DRAFT_312291 [Lindgomyces ingoldianus]|uniref:Uncharacterized protein n=1 Tax=Lindgomyces ingoldianus TaxID=673940 RepID=A0ACB6R2W8_9PLEO|nr:uncharacterized protein BDR25DRAFT_312291 [Lindgomyces ingoldianus]KAF2473168.1 hypothetical protein BDR25DRAFT_312291 [Lindgomyces ingoldianus]